MNKKTPSKDKGLYRDGKRLVIREGARFPNKCAICNKEDDVESIEFFFERKKAHVVEARAVQTALNAASDVMSGAKYTAPVQADIPLCSWHRSRRIQRAAIGVGMATLALVFVLIQKAMGVVIVPPGELGFLDIAIYNFIAFGMIFAGVTFIFTTIFDHQNLWFKATKFYDRFVWVSGAGRTFLDELPQYENQHRRSRIKDLESRFDRSSDENRHLTAEELIRRANLDEE
jgi:hypothetical protein